MGDVELDELLVTTAGGNRTAFEALYERTSPRVFGLVRRMLRDRSQSEDVTCEVFVEIWRTASRFRRADGSASSWILALAHRRAIDCLHRREHRDTRSRRVGRHDGGAPDACADLLTEVVLDDRDARRALAFLPHSERRAIELAYFEGFRLSELAALLNVPLSTAAIRIRKGMVSLRRLVAEGDAPSTRFATVRTAPLQRRALPDQPP